MEDGINKFIGKMTHTHGVTVGGNTLFFTGKLEPIEITVTSRANNKKVKIENLIYFLKIVTIQNMQFKSNFNDLNFSQVTLVNNLEMFGIKMEEFSKECQGIGASATITDVPGKKTPSVLVQGNQVLYVFKLLTGKNKKLEKFIIFSYIV